MFVFLFFACHRNTIDKKMRLYQHSARCPVALRSFLDCNPNYWCFIPLRWDLALGENADFRQGTTDIVPSSIQLFATTALSNPRLARCLDRVPLPPAAYTFSYQQIQQQRLFFENFLSSSIHVVPYQPLDVYKVAIIAVRE